MIIHKDTRNFIRSRNNMKILNRFIKNIRKDKQIRYESTRYKDFQNECYQLVRSTFTAALFQLCYQVVIEARYVLYLRYIDSIHRILILLFEIVYIEVILRQLYKYILIYTVKEIPDTKINM